jgi:dCMP deaminase
MVPLSKWDLRFLKLADHVAQWSKDPSTKVGAVVVDSLRTVLGVGYNGFPRGVPDHREWYDDRSTKYDLIVHAEVNAILSASRGVRGGTLYTTPLFSCVRCAGLVIQSGITRVVSIQKDDANIDWAIGPENKALMMYKEAGIRVDIFTPEVLRHAS